jgi:4-hydroxyphenylacetate 3-hydroxylase, reductase component
MTRPSSVSQQIAIEVGSHGPSALTKELIENPMDTRDLRRAFSQFATGVTVITAKTKDGLRAGVTANSFNTVSLSPPIVLWSLAHSSTSLDIFRRAGHFAVNVLSLEQIALSRRFSQPSNDRFEGLYYTHRNNGAPLLENCSATLECVTLSEQIVGDHVLFLGQVERYRYAEQAPLLFFNGKYVQTSDLP